MAADVDYSVVRQQSAPFVASHLDVHAPPIARWVAWLLVLAAFAAFNLEALGHIRIGDAARLGLENGYLENMQLVALAAAAGLFGYAGRKGSGAVQLAGALLGIVAAAAFLREIDLDRMTWFPTGLRWMETHAFQYALYFVLGVAAIAQLVSHRSYLPGAILLGFAWRALPFVLGVAALAAAEFLLDGGKDGLSLFWEELVEADGYFLIAVGAWVHAGLVGTSLADI